MNKNKLEKQGQSFSDWNRVMRIRLESYARFILVYTISYIIQSTLVLITMYSKLRGLIVGYIVLFCFYLVFNSCITFALLNIKKKEQERHWRNPDSQIMFNTKFDDKIDANDNVIRYSENEKKSFFNKSKKSMASNRHTEGAFAKY